jgi:hypothetical protein
VTSRVAAVSIALSALTIACVGRAAPRTPVSESSEPSQPSIYSVGVDGSDTRDLGVHGRLVSRSGDGRIAFSPSERELAVMNADGSDAQLVVHVASAHRLGAGKPSGDLDAPAAAWSPDGRRIAFSIGSGCEFDDYDCEYWSIWVADVSTGARVRVLVNADEPSWSPDGSRLAFINHPYPWSHDPAEHTPDKPHFVFVRSVGGGQRHRIAEGYFPTWLPDGRRLVYEGERLDHTDVATTMWTGVRVVTLRTRRWRKLAFAPADWSLSSDGTRLAYSPYPSPRIGIVDTAGGKTRLFTRRGHYACHPVWSPDGRHLAWLEGGEVPNETRLVVGTTDATAATRVVARRPGNGSITGAIFTGDGARLLYTVSK